MYWRLSITSKSSAPGLRGLVSSKDAHNNAKSLLLNLRFISRQCQQSVVRNNAYGRKPSSIHDQSKDFCELAEVVALMA
jgi:hypothetical protein